MCNKAFRKYETSVNRRKMGVREEMKRSKKHYLQIYPKEMDAGRHLEDGCFLPETNKNGHVSRAQFFFVVGSEYCIELLRASDR